MDEVCPNQESLLARLGVEISTDPILSTRFAQWCRECGCQDLLTLDIQTSITLYKDSRFTELSELLLDDIIEGIRTNLPQWFIDEGVLRRLHLAWESAENRFVLLSGLTGVGKSNLIWDYAQSVLTLHGLSVPKHRLMVPIQTNFRSSTFVRIR